MAEKIKTIDIFCAEKNKLIIKKKITVKETFRNSVFLLGI